MIAIIHENQGVKKFVADKKDDLLKMDLRTTRMGSFCFVIEEDKSYILNGSGKWIAVSSQGSGGGGSSSGSDDEGGSSDPSDTIPSDTPIDETNNYIWDGGEVK